MLKNIFRFRRIVVEFEIEECRHNAFCKEFDQRNPTSLTALSRANHFKFLSVDIKGNVDRLGHIAYYQISSKYNCRQRREPLLSIKQQLRMTVFGCDALNTCAAIT